MKAKKIENFLFFLPLFFLFGCAEGGSITNSATESKARSNIDCPENLSYAMAKGNADQYKGCGVEWSSQVFLPPEKDEDGIYFQAYANPVESEENFIAGYNNTDFELSDDDYVIVIGTFEGVSEGENAFGAELRLPMIKVTSLQKTDRNDVIAPTLFERVVNKTFSQNNFNVTLEKIEYAESETRFYLTVKNDREDSVNFYTYNSKVVQDGAQFENESIYDDLDELQSEILSGVSDSGVLIFPTLNKDLPLTLHLDDPSGSDYREEWEDVRFDIESE